jgi:ABC-2 type transport system ATP-binding protein
MPLGGEFATFVRLPCFMSCVSSPPAQESRLPDAIAIRGVTKSFGPKVAVSNLDLRVPVGGIYGFIGPNGAGKTTTIRMIMSIIFPDSGEVSVLGRRSAVESKDRIGYLPEERGIYRKMRVGAFLNYMGRLKGVPRRTLRTRIPAWLERIALADCHRKRCEELSKGMQQKVQFLAAVIHEPELVILDEPFSGLDPVNRRLLRELIHEQANAGRTIIFSTHAMHEAEELCDHLFMINRGIKVLDATMPEIRARFDPRTIELEPMDHTVEPPLHALPGIDRSTRARRGYELHLSPGADPAAVMAEAVRSLSIRRIELKRVSLEDVFIELVEAAGQTPPRREELQDEAELAIEEATRA